MHARLVLGFALSLTTLILTVGPTAAQERTHKPVLHGSQWVAVTGKPLAATAGALVFERGGNAVDAACAMLAATATMWDVLGWGGETQALVYDPRTGQVHGINALGIAPGGATAEYFRERGMRYPPEDGPLSAVTPGTPGGLMVMLAEFGTLSLAEVLAPAIRLADGYPMEEDTGNRIEDTKDRIKEWTYSPDVFLPHLGSEDREAPYPGEMFRQPDLAETLRKLVDAEREALDAGAGREEAIMAAYDRFYRGDIAEELARAVQEEGGLLTTDDLDAWEVRIEEPVRTDYKGIDVYKLTVWTQGPVMLQMLNMLEQLPMKQMGYNTAGYIHALYQVMNLAFADRDFYYGDPYFPPEEPVEGLLSKAYAEARVAEIDWERNVPDAKPGDPYAFQADENPFWEYLAAWPPPREGHEGEDAEAGREADSAGGLARGDGSSEPNDQDPWNQPFYRGTTSIQAADADGWAVSVTPSGAWVPAVIAGRTGIGLSQRMQSFVTDPAENPYNVVEPGKRPRVTLTPTLALKEGQPYMAFSVQGGDSQDQNLVQFFLNVVEFGMNPQEAAEAANINSFQMLSSFGEHEIEPGRLLLRDDIPGWVRSELQDRGYDLEFRDRTSGPITAIWFDRDHGTLWGAASDFGDDYGISW